MSLSTQDLAALAKDAYTTRSVEDLRHPHVINGVEYRILQQIDKPSGYQGTIYQRVDSGDVVVAHRGTEFGRELLKDGLRADAGMVLLGVNSQAQDALDATRSAVALADELDADARRMTSVTVTGHSLGGTLAQITAHRLGLRAETFDAYGAAGLVADYPRVDPDIVNHVRSTDFVSAASPHIGEVRVYATVEDIDALSRHGYENGRHLVDLRNPFGVAFGIGVEAHYSDNFVDTNERGQSILNAIDAGRARDNADMIGDYRRDIGRVHAVVAMPRNLVDGAVDLGARLAGHRRRDEAPGSVGADDLPTDPRMPGHPDHPLLRQARDGVHALDASLGRVPDASSDRLIAGVFRGAREAGLVRIDEVVPSAPLPGVPAGASVFAVQGAPDDPLRRIARIDTSDALRTPVEASLRAAATAAPPASPAMAEPVPEQRRAALAR